MKTAATIAQMVLRLAGLTQLILGLLFWSGNALNLIPIHILIGLLLVVSLWTIAALALVARAAVGLPLFAIAWGVVVPWLGLTQDELLPGGAHWVIKLLHLVVGVIAIGLGEVMARKTKHSLGPPAPSS